MMAVTPAPPRDAPEEVVLTSAPRDHVALLRAWAELWYEPWRQMHPAWIDQLTGGRDLPDPPGHCEGADLADRGWLQRFMEGRRPAVVSPALRLGYHWFCGRFRIDASLPLPLDQLNDLPDHVPLDEAGLDRAALALGRVAHVSHCMASAHRGLAQLFSAGGGETAEWRDALRVARARPLHAIGTAPPEGGDSTALRRWALPVMGRLIEDALPGAWPRLRLRCDPALIDTTNRPPAALDAPPAVRRLVWRIWRTSAPPPSPFAASS